MNRALACSVLLGWLPQQGPEERDPACVHNSTNGLQIERITRPRPLGHVEFPGDSVGVFERDVLLAESLVQFYARILDPGL